MTTLAIMANYEKKRLKCYGTVAAGEHVAVTVTDGAQWLGEGKALRLRVLFGPNTVAVFPFADGDAWKTHSDDGTITDGDTRCELNLNTIPAAKYLKCGGTCLWILDDVENHTLYATGEFDVLPWPKRRGIDEPIDLDGYPLLLDEIHGLEEAFEAYKATVEAAFATKQDTIFDLAAIRNGAAAGTTAVQPSQLASYVNGGTYDSTNKKILLKHDENTVAEIDATAFIKDGMVDSVEVAGGNLVITFNTDSGKQPISIPLTDIFDPDAYYDKTAADARFAAKSHTHSEYATKADATLTPIYSDTPTFSDWSITPSSVTGSGEYWPQGTYELSFFWGGPGYWYLEANGATIAAIAGDKDVDTQVTFDISDQMPNAQPSTTIVASRTRTDIIGYQLGNQSDKPLASEQEAADLRTAVAGKLASSDVIDPATATVSGKAADALATKNALGGKQAALGFTPENAANKVTSLSAQSTDTQYPSAKCVYDALQGVDAKPTRIYNAGGTDALDDKGQLFMPGTTGNYFVLNGTQYDYIGYLYYGGWFNNWFYTYANGSDALAFRNNLGNLRSATVSNGGIASIGSTIYEDSQLQGRNPLNGDDLNPTTPVSGLTFHKIATEDASTVYAHLAVESVPTRTIAASTAYAVGDILGDSGKAYRCISAYTSAVTPVAPSSDTTHWEEIPVLAQKANASDLPYALGTVQTISTASQDTSGAETIDYGSATMADRTGNYVAITTALDELRVTFPPLINGKMRDFLLRVEVGTGSAALTAPALVAVAPTGETITLENPDGTMPTIVDGTATAKGVTYLLFSESAVAGKFVVRGIELKEVA